MPETIIQQIFAFCVSRRKFILRSFLVLYILLGLSILSGIRAAVTGNNYPFFYNWAISAGKISVVIFCLVMTPGITRRFGIRSKLVFPLMMYRRYLGISMFLFAVFHASTVRLAPLLFEGFSLSQLALF